MDVVFLCFIFANLIDEKNTSLFHFTFPWSLKKLNDHHFIYWWSTYISPSVNYLFLTELQKLFLHFRKTLCLLYEKVKEKVTQSCSTLCNAMDYSLPGSSGNGIFQTRILEWVAISFSRGFSQPRDQTWVSCFGRQILYHWATWEPNTDTTGWWLIDNEPFYSFLHFVWLLTLFPRTVTSIMNKSAQFNWAL